MDKETFLKYTPLALMIAAIFIQMNLFVTPVQLEQKHREILKDVAQTYTTKEQHNDLKSQLDLMQAKIDKIYEVITKR